MLFLFSESMDVQQRHRPVIEFLTKEECTAVNTQKLRNVSGEVIIDVKIGEDI